MTKRFIPYMLAAALAVGTVGLTAAVTDDEATLDPTTMARMQPYKALPNGMLDNGSVCVGTPGLNVARRAGAKDGDGNYQPPYSITFSKADSMAE